MAKVTANTRVLKETAHTLRQAAKELELQKGTLYDVAALVESAWISPSTVAFTDCIRRTGKNLNQAKGAVNGSAKALEGAANKITMLETVERVF